MLVKLGRLDVLDAWRIPSRPSARVLRKAAHRVAFDYEPRPGFLYVRSRMISSRCNDNHDEFPAPEIEKAYKSFLGKPVFVNHHNSNHRRARGVIVAVALHRDRNADGTADTWVEGLMEVDAVKFPLLAKAIIAKRIDRTSMGVDVDYSICSACGNRAESPAEYCRHMPAFKGKKIRQRNPKTGKLQEEIIREICHGLSFFENSLLVEDPADPTAYFLGDVDQRGLAKAASKTVTAAPVTPHEGGPLAPKGACRENCIYGGTHCLMCHEPVVINLHKTHIASGGWGHADGMRRDHHALPADESAVMRSIPAQQTARQAAMDQARAHVSDTLERQGIPRRRQSWEQEMPPDPFTASRVSLLAHFRKAADTMDETPSEGKQDPLSAILRHLNEGHGAPETGALYGAQEMFRKVHGRPLTSGYGEKPSEEAPASERVKWQTNWAKSYVDAHKGLHYLHQHMHGHDPAAQGEIWKYPREGGEWETGEGEKRGFNHRHTLGDPLVAHPKHVESSPWMDPTSDVHFTPSDSRVIWPQGRGEHGIPDYYKTRDKQYGDLHPERTDEYPNRKKWHTEDDPREWSSGSVCSRTYTREQQDRSYRAGANEPDYREYEDKNQYSKDAAAWREKAKRRGALCPECGAHKWLHAYYKPSEVGKPTEQWKEKGREEWDRNIKGQTGPFIPELPRYSSLSLLAHFRRAAAVPGHFEFFRGLDRPEARPRIDELKDHLREDHWGSNRAMNELEDEAHGNWQPGARYNEAMHYSGLNRMHQDAHEHAIASAENPGHVREHLESQHHPYFEREEEDEREERRAIEEHRENATVRMHGQPASLTDLELHLTGHEHGIPAESLPAYRLPTYTHGPDRYARDLEEFHHLDHGDTGSYRHEDNDEPVHMHGEYRSPGEAEEHLVAWHGHEGPGSHDPIQDHEYPADHLERMHDEAHEDELDDDEPDEHEDLLTHHGRFPAHETEAGHGAERRLENYRQPGPHAYETTPEESASSSTVTHDEPGEHEYDPVFGWRHRSVLLAHFQRAAITGEHAQPGDEIFAAPTGRSPVADHFDHVLDHPDQYARNTDTGRLLDHPHLSALDHGPYYVTRHPDGADLDHATYHVLDREGRETSPHGEYRAGMFSGHYGAYKDWYRLTHRAEPEDPSARHTADIMNEHYEHVRNNPPQFPHSMINPNDEEIARRPDARVHKPEGHSPAEEYHGSYEVVKHPETGRFHVVDNAGRQAGGFHLNFPTQIQAERSRDYVERRQQSKERAKALFSDIYEGTEQIFDPGSTPESRESDRHLERGQELMTRYEGGRGRLGMDDEEEGGEPYYERHHYLPNGNESGWYGKHYGGRVHIYHQATGDTTHQSLMPPLHPEDENRMVPRIHPDFGDVQLGHLLRDWHDEEGGDREYLESRRNPDARISSWKQRYPNGRSPRRQASLSLLAHFERAANHPEAERTESVRHMLAHYKPYDFPTWEEVHDNIIWNHPKVQEFSDHIAEHGVQRPIPVDYEQDPPVVRNGHTRLLAAAREGIETVPTRQYQWFADPDDESPHWLLGHEASLDREAGISDDEIRKGLDLPSVEQGHAEHLRSKFDELFLGDRDWEDYRQSMGNEAMMDLHRRYEHGDGGFGFRHNDDDESGSPSGSPYYEIRHRNNQGQETGWRIRHYNDGPIAEIEHAGEPDDSQETIDLPRAHYGDNAPHDWFGHEHLSKMLHDWYHGVLDRDEPDENRKYLEQNRPRIQRWQRRRLGSVRAEGAHYENPEDHPFFQANPISPQNITDAYNDSTDDEKDQGHRWYEDAHHVAGAIAGGDTARGAGLLAAYSPRTAWPSNLFNASRAHREDRAFGGPGEGAMGVHRKLAEPIIAGIHHSAAFRESAPKIGAFAHLIEHGGDTQDDIDQGSQRVVIDRHALSTAIGRRVSDEDLDKSPIDKPRYYEHVADAYRQAAADLTHVLGQTISPHQIQAVVWLRQIRKNEEEDRQSRGGGGKGRIQRNRNARDRWQQHQVDVGLEIPEGNMHREGDLRKQAISDECKHCGCQIHQSEGSWIDNGGGDVCGWKGGNEPHEPEFYNPLDYMMPFDPSKHGAQGGPTLSRKLAYGETTVPPRIDTLRQETCPVCGESEVWTGQRCPVCGFTAPPDIFRDPDLTRAQQLRDETGPEEEGPVPGFPQGPADEQQLAQQQTGQDPQQMGSFPDAQAQMFHPDQLAPNGTPAPVSGTGLNGMPQSPEDEEEQGEQEIGAGEDEEQEGQQEAEQGAEDEALDQQEVQLGCPACGNTFAPGDHGAQPDQPCPACGQAALVPVDDEDGPEKGQEPQEGIMSKGTRTAQRPQPRPAPRTAAQAATQIGLQRMAYLEHENRVLRTQLNLMARLAGCEAEFAAIRRQADLLNPAQPVPDPPQGPPAQTTEEALMSGAPTGSGSGLHRGPGHTEDDVSRPGATPGSMTAVPSEKTTTAITPGVEIQTPPANQLLDVTAPIQGTNPSQDGGVPMEQRRIETDVRIDPDPLKASGPGIGGIGDNGTAYPWYLNAASPQGSQGSQGGPQQRAASLQRQAPPGPGDVPAAEAAAAERTWASMRLAKLRIQAGLVRGDELELAAHIERDAAMSMQLIDHEIATLARMNQMRPAQPQRRPVQRTAAARMAPSLAAGPAPAPLPPAYASVAYGGGGYGQADSDSDMFL